LHFWSIRFSYIQPFQLPFRSTVLSSEDKQKIWMPFVVFSQTRQQAQLIHGRTEVVVMVSRDQDDQIVAVSLTKHFAISLTITCSMDFTSFPFDSNECFFQVNSEVM